MAAPPRVLASVRSPEPGPTLVVVASIHGNEPAGAVAAARVLAGLGANGLRRGDLLVLTGNAAAAARGERSVDRDLNRAFTPDHVARARRGEAPAELGAEGAELRDLLHAIDGAVGAARGPRHLLDLHSTSGEGAPFLLLPSDGSGEALAAAIPLTAVSGLLARIPGTMAEALRNSFDGSIVAECGSHASPAAPDCAEAVILSVLAATGMGADAPASRERLAALRGSLPRSLRVVHRHGISPADRFVMRPGWRHFDPVEAGTVVADDARGPVRAPVSGRMLLPLYQKVGDDGFFLAQ